MQNENNNTELTEEETKARDAKLINYKALKAVAEALKKKIDTKADTDSIKIEGNVITVGTGSIDVGDLIDTTGGKINEIQINGATVEAINKIVNIAYDTELSDTSTNAVQNKVIKEALDNVLSDISFENGTLSITIKGESKEVFTTESLKTALGLKTAAYADVAATLDDEDTTGLVNVAIVKALAEAKANAATTLAGYGITDAYTADVIEGKLDALDKKIESLNGFKYKVVTELPEASTATMYTIYFVKDERNPEDTPVGTPEPDENYNEYITIESEKDGEKVYSWEKIGDTTVNLSGYVKKGTAINGYSLHDNITLKASDINTNESYTTGDVTYVHTVQSKLDALNSENINIKDTIGVDYVAEVRDEEGNITQAETLATGMQAKIRKNRLDIDYLKENTIGNNYNGDSLLARTENAETKISKLETKVGNYTEGTTSASGLCAKIEGLEAADSAHEGRLDSAEGRLTALEGNLNGDAGLINQVSTNTTNIATNANDISAIKTQLDGDNGLESKVAANANNISSIDGRLTTAESDIDTLEDELDNASTGVKKRITDLEGSIASGSALDTRITNLEDNLNGNDDKSIVGLNAKVSTLQSEVEAETTGLLARTSTLEGTVNGETTGLVARTTALESALDNETNGVKKRITDLETTVNDGSTGLTNRMNNAESEISAIKTAIGDNADGLAQKVATNATNIETLQTVVGDTNTGLVKDVSTNASDISALQTTVGNSTSGLVKDVSDIKNVIGTASTEAGISATGLHAAIEKNTQDIALHNTVTTIMQSAIDTINTTSLPSKANKNGDSDVDFTVKVLTAEGVTIGGKAVATEEYVTANGGKINTISINGAENKVLIDSNKNVDITIPTKTSDIVNDKGFVRATDSTLAEPVVTRNCFTTKEELERVLPYGSTSIVFVISENAIGYYKDSKWNLISITA